MGATQQFERGKYRYIPGPVVRFNGERGRLWDRRELRDRCWMFCGRSFHPLKATRLDIAG